jgi:hypothetical protein
MIFVGHQHSGTAFDVKKNRQAIECRRPIDKKSRQTGFDSPGVDCHFRLRSDALVHIPERDTFNRSRPKCYFRDRPGFNRSDFTDLSLPASLEHLFGYVYRYASPFF